MSDEHGYQPKRRWHFLGDFGGKAGDKSIERGYQPKTDKPLRQPPVGGSNVKPPPSPKEDKK